MNSSEWGRRSLYRFQLYVCWFHFTACCEMKWCSIPLTFLAASEIRICYFSLPINKCSDVRIRDYRYIRIFKGQIVLDCEVRSWTIWFIKMNEIFSPHLPRFTFSRFYAKLNTKRHCVCVRICTLLLFVLCMKCSSVYVHLMPSGSMVVAHDDFPSINAVVWLALWILCTESIFSTQKKNTHTRRQSVRSFVLFVVPFFVCILRRVHAGQERPRENIS